MEIAGSIMMSLLNFYISIIPPRKPLCKWIIDNGNRWKKQTNEKTMKTGYLNNIIEKTELVETHFVHQSL